LLGRGWDTQLGQLTARLCAEMVLLGGAATSLQEAEAKVRTVVASGEAARRMEAFLALHGGDPRVVQEPDRLPAAPLTLDVLAEGPGVVQAIAGLDLGLVAMELGAGRRSPGDRIDPAVGLEVLAPLGTVVAPGEPLARLHLPRGVDRQAFATRTRACWRLAPEGISTPSWLLQELG
jgi:thymidine phosphorylase